MITNFISRGETERRQGGMSVTGLAAVLWASRRWVWLYTRSRLSEVRITAVSAARLPFQMSGPAWGRSRLSWLVGSEKCLFILLFNPSHTLILMWKGAWKQPQPCLTVKMSRHAVHSGNCHNSADPLYSKQSAFVVKVLSTTVLTDCNSKTVPLVKKSPVYNSADRTVPVLKSFWLQSLIHNSVGLDCTKTDALSKKVLSTIKDRLHPKTEAFLVKSPVHNSWTDCT